MEFTEFSAKQRNIYDRFNQAMAGLKETGMQPDTVITERKGGYFINFALPSSIGDAVELFAAEVKKEVPDMVVYAKEMLHTTLSDFMVSPGFVPHESLDYNTVSGKLAQAALAAYKLLNLRSECFYEEGFVFNGTTGILKGQPTGSFLLYAETIVKEASKLGVDLRLPWGAHVTFARASEVVSPSDSVRLEELCNKTKIKKVRGCFTAIQVGSFTADSVNGFVARYYDSFPLYVD